MDNVIACSAWFLMSDYLLLPCLCYCGDPSSPSYTGPFWVALVLLWILVDAGTGYAVEIWESLMNAFSMQSLKQPLFYRCSAKMVIQVGLVLLPCLLYLYLINIVEPCLYSCNCWYHFPVFLLFARPLLSLCSFIDSQFFIKSHKPNKATYIAA